MALKRRRKDLSAEEVSVPAEVPQIKTENLKPDKAQDTRTAFKSKVENLTGDDKKYHMRKIPHDFLTSFNRSRTGQTTNFREYPLCRISKPHSIWVTDCQPNKMDLCHNRTADLWSYNFELRRLPTYYKSMRKRKKIVRKAEKKGIYPSVLFKFAELLECNPDPFFNSRYDYYYTGGNLDVDSNCYILHAQGEHLETLVVSKFDGQQLVQLATHVNEDEPTTSEIFEIQSLTSSFSVRRKHSVTLYSHDEQSINSIVQLESEKTPLISSTPDKCNENFFVTSDLNQEIRIWDLDRQWYRIIDFNRAKTNGGNWNAIKFYSRDTYAFCTLNEFCLWDSRLPKSEAAKNFCTFRTPYDNCELNASLAISQFDNLIYVGTTHKLHCLDVRYLQTDIWESKSPVMRWTHQMDSSPLMLKTMKRGDQEVILMASPHSGDMRICELIRECGSTETETDPSKFIYQSPCLPYMPATLKDCYDGARNLGKCLDPSIRLESRINVCNTGLSFLTVDSKSFYFNANSLGDVFAHKISYDNEDEVDVKLIDDDCAIMTRYEESVRSKQPEFTLTCTEIKDLTKWAQLIRDEQLDTKPVEIKEEVELPERPKPRPRWERSMKELSEYKDVLAPDLLAIWDIDEDDDIPLPQSQSQPNPINLVSDWLNQTSVALSDTMVSIPASNLTSDYFEMSQLSTVSNLERSFNKDQPSTSGLNESKAKTTAKRKSQYVKGF